MRRPTLTAVPAAVDFAAIGGAGHQRRPVFVEGQSEHRVRWLQTHIDVVPSVTAVAAIKQHAALALEIAAGRNKQLARIAGNLTNVAAIDLPFGV